MTAKKMIIRSGHRPVVPMKQSKPTIWPAVAVLVLIVCYAVFFSAVALLQYHSFSFHDLDLAVINQNFYNAVRGVLVSPELGVHALFSGHKWIIIFPLLPLYIIFPGPELLLILQSVALALGAWAVFLLATRLTNRYLGLIMAFAYLIYPAMNFVNLFEFHPIAFATPLLLFAFYFLKTRRWGMYLSFVFLSLSVRQDVAISVFALGVYALISGLRDKTANGWRRWRWALIPLSAAVAWFYICVSVIPGLVVSPSPVKSPGMVEMFFGWLGDTPGEILKTIITQPGYVLGGIFTAAKLTYVWQILSPAALLPLFSPTGLFMVLVSMTEGLLSGRFTHFSIRYQYSSIITPMVFASACLGLQNLMNWKLLRRAGKYLGLVIILAAILTAWSFGPIPHLPQQFPSWRFTREDAVRQAMVNLIPPAEPITATFEFSPKLSNRPQLFFWYHLYASSRRPDWGAHVPLMQEQGSRLLIDFDDWLTFYDFYTPGGHLDVYKFLYDGKWELIVNVNSLALFKKGEKPKLGVVSLVGKGFEKSFRPIQGISQLRFAGFSATDEKSLGYLVVNVSVDLECRNKTNDDLLLVARFINQLDPSQEFQQFFFAPYQIYPTSRWEPGDIVRQKCNLLVPENIPGGDYDMILSLIRKRPNLPLSPEAKKLFYNYYDTAMAMKYLPGRWGISPENLLEQIVIARIPKAVIIE